MKIEEIKKRVEEAITKIAEEFKENRALYLSESDMKCRLFKLIDEDKTYSSNGHKTYLIHTEVGLYGADKINKVDIYIAEFVGFKLELKWEFDKTEDIGIELKYNYNNKNSQKDWISDELKKDATYLRKNKVLHKYIVCFDHNGHLTKEEFNCIINEEEFEGVNITYVDGKNQKVYKNAIQI